jgi:hypothetical protein
MVLRLGVEVSRAEAYKLRPKAKKEGRHDPEKRALVQVPGNAPGPTGLSRRQFISIASETAPQI